MRRKLWFAAAVLFLFLCACGKNRSGSETADESSGEPSIIIKVSDEREEAGSRSETASGAAAWEGAAQEEETASKRLHFVDAFGQEYEVEINDRIEKNPYDPAGFERTGDLLKYEDELFTSRMGIDVSKYQGEIDWKSVREAGIEFAFLRIGYRGYGAAGTINLDQTFRQNIERAQREGIDVGVYFFAQAINEEEAEEEANFVIKHLAEYELQLPVVYDPESILEVEARTDDVTGEQFTRNTIAFCEAVKAAGYAPMIYCNMLWEAYNLDLEELSEYPIWYADYEEYPQTPYRYEYWQYSSEGKVRGVTGETDLNIQFIRKQDIAP